jgi:transcriptional regulator with XRE-family HTH domain
VGLTQAALAEAVDLSIQYIGLLERGAAAPSLETLVAIAAVLKAPLREFFPLETADEEEETMAAMVAIFRPLGTDQRRRALRILRAAFHDE